MKSRRYTHVWPCSQQTTMGHSFNLFNSSKVSIKSLLLQSYAAQNHERGLHIWKRNRRENCGRKQVELTKRGRYYKWRDLRWESFAQIVSWETFLVIFLIIICLYVLVFIFFYFTSVLIHFLCRSLANTVEHVYTFGKEGMKNSTWRDFLVNIDENCQLQLDASLNKVLNFVDRFFSSIHAGTQFCDEVSSCYTFKFTFATQIIVSK